MRRMTTMGHHRKHDSLMDPEQDQRQEQVLGKTYADPRMHDNEDCTAASARATRSGSIACHRPAASRAVALVIVAQARAH